MISRVVSNKAIVTGFEVVTARDEVLNLALVLFSTPAKRK